MAAELSKRSTGKTVYILDEPTTGLHFADVHKLTEILQKLSADGNTVVVIEHNLDVIKTADYLIDIGPEGGDKGGTVIAKGTPEQMCIRDRNGVLQTADVIEAGISKTYFMEYAKKMELERVAKGIYLSPDAWEDPFYLLQTRYTQIIFSHETSLYLLGMAEREPLQFMVNVK